MPFSLIPKIRVESIFDVTPEMLLSRKINLLLLDLDNTLSPYSGLPPTQTLFKWKERHEANGIKLYLVSNTKTERAHRFAGAFGIPFINKAKKPSSRQIKKVIAECGRRPHEAALAGDQIFTDVLGANLSGLTSIIVKPIKFKNPLIALRYFAEMPFRLIRRKEEKRHD